jgi:hypothetical protein
VTVHAVHIDYANREESRCEAAFVARWCEQQGIELGVRRIDEVTRGITARDEYEKRSRELRFEAYRAALDGHGAGAGMMLGHHRGDVQENCMSNIMKGRSILEISGMTRTSVVERVTVWRPLLTHAKDEVFALAHRFKVPYLKDTTPKWSTRGKLRDQLLPTCQAVYGEGFRRNLSALAEQSDELHAFLDATVFAPFFGACRRGRLALVAPLDAQLDRPAFFWRYAFRQLCHSMGYATVKDRAAEAFAARLNRRELRPDTEQGNAYAVPVLLKETQPSYVVLQPGDTWLVLGNEGCSWQRAPSQEQLVLRPGDARRFGCFLVAVSQPARHPEHEGEGGHTTEREEEPTLGQAPCASWIAGGAHRAARFCLADWLAEGELAYALPHCEQGFSLCKGAGKRLRFFHGVDRRVRLAIPVLNLIAAPDPTRHVTVLIRLADVAG